MIKKLLNFLNHKDFSALRFAAAYLVSFFLIMTLLTAFIAVPKINQFLEEHYVVGDKQQLEIEAELFKRFVSNYRTSLEGLAKFPVISGAVLLSKIDNPDLIDLLDNFSLSEEKPRLILQNIEGTVIYQTIDGVDRNYSDAHWVDKLLNEEISYNFQLIGQDNESFTFIISVPVYYMKHVEGILSAEITVPLSKVFSARGTADVSSAFKLQQGNVVVQTNADSIVSPRETPLKIDDMDIKITHVIDNTKILKDKRKLRNIILGVLFLGLTISFLLFSALGYRLVDLGSTNPEGKFSILNRAYYMPLLMAIIGVSASISGFLMISNQETYNAIGDEFDFSSVVAAASLSAWIVLLTGLALTFFITYIFIQLIRRKQRIEIIVEQRTQEIQDAKKFQDLIMNSIPDMLFVMDEERCIVQANPSFLSIYPKGMRDSIIGKSPSEGLWPEAAKDLLNIDKALHHGHSEKEETILFPDGEKRTLFTKKVKFQSFGKNFILGIARDISAMKHAETEREELRIAMENTVEGVSCIDTEGRYLYLNEAYASTCGYKPEELVGQNWEVTVHQEDHESMNNAYQVMLDTGKVSAEPRGVRKNGSVFYKRVTMISLYNEQQDFIGHYCFMSNISERKEAEEQLRLANAELEEFAYRTSHDLRAPLVSSIQLLSIIRGQIEGGQPDLALEALGHAQNSLQTLENLVKDILALTKTKHESEKDVSIDIHALIDKTLDKLSYMDGFDQLAVEKSLKFEGELISKTNRIILILENLISNAIKYQDVNKQNSYVRISTYNEDGCFVLDVLDNGLGIPKDQQNKMFKMFRRFHPTTSFGSGLGLYMMKKSADILNADLIYDDVDNGNGTLFRLVIPCSNDNA